MNKFLVPLVLVITLALGASIALRPINAPDINVTLLNGATLNTQSLRGKVVLVNFWATTCTICMHEMPNVIDTYKQFQARGFETVAVAMDYDNPAWIRDVSMRARMPFIVAQDRNGSAAKAFGDVQLTPTSFLIDRHGHIVQQYLGEPDFDKLHALLDRLLAESV